MAYVPPHLRNKAAASPSTSDSNSYSSRPSRATHSTSQHLSPRPNQSHNQTANGTNHSNQQSYQSRSPARTQRRSVALCVFGDSFAGPFKLLSDECVKVQTFKGASAKKGLNNANSLKQVSAELVPLLNGFLAPPPYAYMPPTGRSALLLFGNVDLQVNYLWQLQHKPIGKGTWSESEGANGTAEAVNEVAESDTEQIMASATENSGKGPALGPELFVDNVVKAYTSWLEREVVNGPIGRRAAEVAKQDGETGTRRLAPTKVLVAAALPPLIEDDTLPRIPEKYVERLEEDHVRAHRALERGERDRGSRTPWARPTDDKEGTEEIGRGLAAASLNGSRTITPVSKSTPDKTSVEDLLKHDPPLCTKPVRVAMTQRYNEAMAKFCAQFPNVIHFVDIWDEMLEMDVAEREKEAKESGTRPTAPSIPREVDRASWACPIDVSNIHPLWEPTLPLWLKKLEALGVPTDTFAFNVDAEATFKAYEEDKKRRTEQRDFRIKLRDE